MSRNDKTTSIFKMFYIYYLEKKPKCLNMQKKKEKKKYIHYAFNQKGTEDT